MNWEKLIGMKILAFRGVPTKTYVFKDSPPLPPKVPMSIMLFDDEKTFIEFHEQDYYDYHDCNGSARTVCLSQNSKQWKLMFEKVNFDEPTNLNYPF